MRHWTSVVLAGAALGACVGAGGCGRRVTVVEGPRGGRVTRVHRPLRPDITVVDPPGPGRGVIVRGAPPAPKLEVRTRAPSAKHVWIAGHWERRGRTWVWKKGHWVKRPKKGAAWIPARWVKSGDGWTFKQGYWR